MKISKSTCVKWGQELSSEIRSAKAERMANLYRLYQIGQEQHVKRLGETLKRIDAELAKRETFADIPTERLLKIKLEYEEKLQALFHEATESTQQPENDSGIEDTDGALKAVCELYRRIRDGTTDSAQARIELETIDAARRAATDKNNEW